MSTRKQRKAFGAKERYVFTSAVSRSEASSQDTQHTTYDASKKPWEELREDTSSSSITPTIWSDWVAATFVAPTSPHSLLCLPNAVDTKSIVSRHRHEELVDLHVRPFVNPYVGGYCTNTGARKHSRQAGILCYITYTPADVTRFSSITGSTKDLFLEDIIIAHCDEPSAEIVSDEVIPLSDHGESIGEIADPRPVIEASITDNPSLLSATASTPGKNHSSIWEDYDASSAGAGDVQASNLAAKHPIKLPIRLKYPVQQLQAQTKARQSIGSKRMLFGVRKPIYQPSQTPQTSQSSDTESTRPSVLSIVNFRKRANQQPKSSTEVDKPDTTIAPENKRETQDIANNEVADDASAPKQKRSRRGNRGKGSALRRMQRKAQWKADEKKTNGDFDIYDEIEKKGVLKDIPQLESFATQLARALNCEPLPSFMRYNAMKEFDLEGMLEETSLPVKGDYQILRHQDALLALLNFKSSLPSALESLSEYSEYLTQAASSAMQVYNSPSSYHVGNSHVDEQDGKAIMPPRHGHSVGPIVTPATNATRINQLTNGDDEDQKGVYIKMKEQQRLTDKPTKSMLEHEREKVALRKRIRELEVENKWMRGMFEEEAMMESKIDMKN